MHVTNIRCLTPTRAIRPTGAMTTRSSLWLAIAFVLLIPVLAMAGPVSGRIYGPDNMLVRDTTFNAKLAKGGKPVEFKIDSSGYFSVYLDPGRYTVSPKGDDTQHGEVDSTPEPVQQDIHLRK